MSLAPKVSSAACRIALAASVAVAALASAPASAAGDGYPFEGTWIRADRTCSATTTAVRTYTAKDVTSPLGRCMIRRIAGGRSNFELLEQCRRSDRDSTVTESIRMSGPDAMLLRRQVSRLKIPRGVRYLRCAAAAPAQPVHPAPARPITRAPAPRAVEPSTRPKP